MAFAINTNDGRISTWVDGVSNCQYHPIPDDVAKAVDEGTVKWEAVVNAINKKRYMDKDFDWTALRAAEEQLNVRTARFEFADENKVVGESDKQELKNSISMDDVMDESDDTKSVTANMVEGKKATARKSAKVAKADTPDIFDDGAPEEAK